MCDKDLEIKQLESDKHKLENDKHELEKLLSETRKNYFDAEKLHSERRYNDIRTQYHSAQVLAVPIAIGLIGIIIALIK